MFSLKLLIILFFLILVSYPSTRPKKYIIQMKLCKDGMSKLENDLFYFNPIKQQINKTKPRTHGSDEK